MSMRKDTHSREKGQIDATRQRKKERSDTMPHAYAKCSCFLLLSSSSLLKRNMILLSNSPPPCHVSVARQNCFYLFSQLIQTVPETMRSPKRQYSTRSRYRMNFLFAHFPAVCRAVCSVSFTSKFVCGSVNRFFHSSSCRVMALNGPYKTQHITFVTVATSKMQREQKKTTKQNRSPKLLLLFTWICLFTALQRQT